MIRKPKYTENFTVTPNALANDANVSAEGLGVMLYLLSKPDDWVVVMGDLRKRFNCGRDKMRRVVKELEKAGYLMRVENKEKGRFAKVDYDVYPSPQSENPQPLTENPSPVNPSPENPSLNKERTLPKTDSTKTADGGHFDDFWKVVPKKVGKGAARVAYAKALKKADHNTIGRAMYRYFKQAETQDQKYVVHPARWLNEERWTDEPPPPSRKRPNRNHLAG